MYPNPAAVIPLPPRPSLEQYKKRAKTLVNADLGPHPRRRVGSHYPTTVE
jgi:hypothetical protein